MLEHRYRFHGHSSLRYVYRNGRIVRGRYFTLRYSKNPQRVHSRVAVIVAKKVVKAAPKRNRIRRRIYEAVRLDQTILPAGYDVVITVQNPEVLLAPFETICSELNTLARAARLSRD